MASKKNASEPKAKEETKAAEPQSEPAAKPARPKAVRRSKKAEPVPEARQRVVVEGRRRRLQTFNLPHEIYCKAMGQCYCTKSHRIVSYRSPEDKQRHTKKEEILNCANFSIRYRERISIARAALDCPEVKAAIASKRLRIRGK